MIDIAGPNMICFQFVDVISKTGKLAIIDDEPLICEALSIYFSDYEWDVKTFESAEEALEVQNFDFEYAIVDLRLPGMNGDELIPILLGQKPNLKAILYTGSIEYQLTDNLKKFNFSENQLVRKPAKSMNDLRETLLNIA